MAISQFLNLSISARPQVQMFTGIVETMGTVVQMTPRRRRRALTVAIPRLARHAHRGDSVAINGVCLSVVSRRGNTLTFEVIPETLRRTTLRALRRGDRINVERALPAGGRLHGHVVLGHVDGTARIVAVQTAGAERWMDINMPPRWQRYCVPKGSIAIDGVSLTIGSLRGNRLRVYLIPTTLTRTTLGSQRAGDRVNLETDWLVKAAQTMMV